MSDDVKSDATRVLFIAHDAGATGAPIWLLTLLRELHNSKELCFDVLLKRDGVLAKDFSSLAPTAAFRGKGGAPAGGIRRISKKLRSKLRSWRAVRSDAKEFGYEHIEEKIKNRAYDLIYSNTITNGHILHQLSPFDCPVITHVHELGHWITKCGPENLAYMKMYTDRYIAASNAVKTFLVTQCSITADDIDVIHSFVPTSAKRPSADEIQTLRDDLGISNSAFIVVGSGHETWRKGKDIFLELCLKTNAVGLGREFYFLWVGGWESVADKEEIGRRIAQHKLQDKIRFLGHVSNPLDYFAAANVFAMVSREDPYPLVCLEAASLCVPILCFADAGGIPEFVEHDAGFIVPYGDVDAMADRVVYLSTRPELVLKLGVQAAQKVHVRHSVNRESQKIQALIQMVAQQGSGHE